MKDNNKHPKDDASSRRDERLVEEVMKTPQEWCKDCVIGNHHRHETEKLIKLAIEASRQAEMEVLKNQNRDNLLKEIAEKNKKIKFLEASRRRHLVQNRRMRKAKSEGYQQALKDVEKVSMVIDGWNEKFDTVLIRRIYEKDWQALKDKAGVKE